MFYCLNHNRVIYILSNLIVLPTIIIPKIDLLANLSFVISFYLLFKANIFLSFLPWILFIIKNNSSYRFTLLLKLKGDQLAKSDYECVYLFAWCTLLRYCLIGMAANQIVIFLK